MKHDKFMPYKKNLESFVTKSFCLVAVLVSVSGSILVSGCASNSGVPEFPATANVSDELNSFERDVDSARERLVHVYSPKNFERAKESLDDAKKSQQKGDNRGSTLHEIALGKEALKKAEEFSSFAKDKISSVAAARISAVESDAPSEFAKEFNEANKNLLSLTSDIENNTNVDVSKSAAPLQAAFLNVELKAIDKKNLGQSRDLIALAIEEGATQSAKQSLAVAVKNVSDTEGYIVANRHDASGIESRSQISLASAQELLKINRDSKAAKNMTPEELVLMRQKDATDMQNKNEALEAERDQKNTQLQTQQIVSEDALIKEKERSVKQLAAASDRNKALATQTELMGANIAFEKKFETARAEFGADEAQVYKQGNNLVIRLRTLAFPSNRSTLRESNFPVLAKVAKVVEEFPGARVIVEGHTDSDGGKALNGRLSQERAKMVSGYLLSNTDIAAGQISSVGFGYDRPLATNKTVKGKAQNRRVDVVISPPIAMAQ